MLLAGNVARKEALKVVLHGGPISDQHSRAIFDDQCCVLIGPQPGPQYNILLLCSKFSKLASSRTIVPTKLLVPLSSTQLSSHGSQGREEARKEGGQDRQDRWQEEEQGQGRVLQDLHLQGPQAGEAAFSHLASCSLFVTFHSGDKLSIVNNISPLFSAPLTCLCKLCF
jgi:hypothetical protein